ncbi:MAG TPA: hypothetical protein VNV17_10745 [Solirubrobacteraceae bacterium]|jgi:hypothetical protein|nr:hypothetical protein [Solirubrobacteraceae bacterium]
MRRFTIIVTLAVVALGLPGLGLVAFAADRSATPAQLEKALAGAAGAAEAGRKGASTASLQHIGSLAKKVGGKLSHPSASCKKGLAAAERLARERRDVKRLRSDISKARAGIKKCKPGPGTNTTTTRTGTTQTATTQTTTTKTTTTNTTTTVVPEEGLGTVNEIKIVSTRRFDGTGSQDFCDAGDPPVQHWNEREDADVTYESDIHLDRSLTGTDTLELDPGASYSIVFEPPCTGGSYHLTSWTNGELKAALQIADDGTGAVALNVVHDVLDQDGFTTLAYGPGLPPPTGPIDDWGPQFTYPGFKTGMSEEINWPSPMSGGSPSIGYTPLGIGGHIVAQLHETKDLADSPSFTGTADILIELLSS